MTLPALTRKEALWLSCKKKSCCSNIIVTTGRDMWRIARALDTPPWSFMVYFPSQAPSRDAFLLDHSGQPYRLALAKQTPRRPRKTLPPCIFLLRTGDGTHRCGLGQLRPLVCRAYPSEVQGSMVYLRGTTTCTCRDWSLVDVDLDEERALVEARQADAREYWALLERWNAQVLASVPGTRFTFGEFASFLLDHYDQIEAATTA